MSTTLDELAERSAAFEPAHPRDVVAWTWERYGDRAVLTSSFEDAVLLDMVAEVAPQLPVVFLDTQYLFAETWWWSRSCASAPTSTSSRPSAARDAARQPLAADVEGCCARPQGRAAQRARSTGKAAWVTGVRRADGPTRADTPDRRLRHRPEPRQGQPARRLDRRRHGAYIAEPRAAAPTRSAEQGYPSIGCWPCTRPVAPGEDRRAGRWAGNDKTECGLHLARLTTDQTSRSDRRRRPRRRSTGERFPQLASSTSSRPRRSPSSARSPPSARTPCCCSAAARTPRCCCTSPCRPSRPAGSRSR